MGCVCARPPVAAERRLMEETEEGDGEGDGDCFDDGCCGLSCVARWLECRCRPGAPCVWCCGTPAPAAAACLA